MEEHLPNVNVIVTIWNEIKDTNYEYMNAGEESSCLRLLVLVVF